MTKPTNLNYLFIDQIRNFAHLVTSEVQTKDEFLAKVKQVYDIESNVKNGIFYRSVVNSDFDTIRLSDNGDSILFNQ